MEEAEEDIGEVIDEGEARVDAADEGPGLE